MKTGLVLNKHNKIALFYDEELGFTPEWASIDVQHREIFIGAPDGQSGKQIKLEEIKKEIYDRIFTESEIFLVRTALINNVMTPVETHTVSLMIAQEM